MQQVYVTAPNQFSVSEVVVPSPGPRDALVQVNACGICGSDLAYLAMGGMPGGDAKGMPLGHELSGVISQLGRDVQGLAVGQRVVVNPLAAGNNIGNGGSEGGFCHQLLVKNAAEGGALVPLPDALSFEQGALVEPLGVAMHAINQAEAKPGDKVVVFGAGPIGLGVVACLRDRGIDDVIAVDLSSQRLAIAEQLGAARGLNGASPELWADINALHGAADCYGMPVSGSDVFIDAAGSGPVFAQMLNQAKFGARIVMVAMHKHEATLPVFQIMAKELSIRGSMAYPDEYAQVLDMLQAGRVDVRPMVTHRFPIERFAEAMATAQRPDTAAKVLVTFS